LPCLESSDRNDADRGDLRLRVVHREALDDVETSRMLDAILESFGTWPPFDPGVPALDHLRWKMSSPAGHMAAIVGEVGDEIACCQVCLSQQVRIGETLVSRVRSTDFAVRPEFRGRGVASALAAFKSRVLERPTLRLTESRAPEIRHLSRKAGAQPLGNPVRALLLPLTASRARTVEGGAWRSVRSRFENAALVGTSRVRRALRRRRTVIGPAGCAEIVVRRLARFDQRFAAFWDDARRAFDVAVERSPEYLNWRYCDPRGGGWIVEACESGASVLGYSAWRVVGERAILADLLALTNRLDVVGRLVDATVAQAAPAGVASILCWLPARHPYRAVLHDRGFLDRPTRVTHMVRLDTVTAEMAALLLAPSTRIHFTLGDSDFV
jgi:hypothetical protein